MPGSPDPVLGSQLLTHGVASAVGLALVAAVYAARRRIAGDRLSAALVGAGYAAATLAVWAAVRAVTDAVPSGVVEDLPAALAVLTFSFLLLTGFVLATARLYARLGLLVPLVGLFVVTELVWWAFLHVRGETDALGMFIVFGPVLVVAVLVASGVEYVGRRGWDRFVRRGGRSAA